MPGKDLCLLSLDGGGVRGLSSLAILKRLMETINPDSPPKPCEYFDMIGGTSTGGLMAIMLGRLEMDIDECIDAYVKISNRVFQKKRHRITVKGQIQGRFDTKELEAAIRDMVKQKDKAGEDALLKGSKDQRCKVSVLES
jgi:patatin-like phospholipase/acyl hydrolase